MSRLIRADWHVHTNLSDCGDIDAAPMAMVIAAQKAGLEAIGFSDHVYLPEHRVRPGRVRQLLPREMDGLRIYVGCEADMQTPTRVSIDEEYAAGLDYVLIAASHLFDPGVERRRQTDVKSMVRWIFDLMNGAIESGIGDVIVHPFGVPMCPHEWAELIEVVDGAEWLATAQAAARAGIAMEFNPRYLKQAPEHARWLFGKVLEAGCKLAVSSDAHHPSQVGCRGERYATEEEMRAVGVGDGDVWRVEGTARQRQR